MTIRQYESNRESHARDLSRMLSDDTPPRKVIRPVKPSEPSLIESLYARIAELGAENERLRNRMKLPKPLRVVDEIAGDRYAEALSPLKTDTIVAIRRQCYRALIHEGYRVCEIAKLFRRDHSTILHGLKGRKKNGSDRVGHDG